ncbi:hypothetical protein GCM10027168_01860 [Streptomyces capparidis]
MATKEERAAFLARVSEALGDASTPEQVTAAYCLVKREGRALGNSANWQGACDWLVANYEEATDDARRRWVALEGFAMMESAND